MTHRTKRLILILLAAALARGMAIPAFGTGTAGGVNLMAVNDTVMDAAGEILSILQAEQCRTQKRIHLAQGITGPQDEEA